MKHFDNLELPDELDCMGELRVALTHQGTAAYLNREEALELMTHVNKLFDIGLDDYLETSTAPKPYTFNTPLCSAEEVVHLKAEHRDNLDKG